ncbi:hypothetical protein [Lactobacillus sp. PV034]|uniref:hypothetical protein n=1 Tax=Lactobacillus sp. PV034 TaxID=2594495 RepID=UPI0022409F44|nr:hypothetical protein [Lactobacillus sp. PV034]QNQ80629.1 hypothetical protein FP432_03220 [Lactobacillus sp. PV034]
MKNVKIIFAMFVLFLIESVAGCVNTQETINENIKKANIVTLHLQKSGVKLYFNLAAKKLYGDSQGVKNNTVYDYDDNYQDKLLGFNYTKKINLLYPLIADKTTVGEVKRSDYVIVKNVKNNSEQKKLMDFLHDYGFKGYRVKIFYNHDCLPVKVQLIDRETNKWKTIAKYSYPRITAKQYEKNWKEYVKKIKAGDFLDE